MSARSMELFDVWDTYKKVVAGDHMFHSKIGAGLAAALARFAGRPYSLLDLGCGDAFAIAPLLREIPPAAYRGVDLSDTALALAAQNLQGLPFEPALKNADLLDALAEGGAYDVVYSSFALHHLTTERKAEFFRRAAQRLAPDGVLLLVDVVRDEDETLPAYLERYTGWIRTTWEGFTPLEHDSIREHILTYDMPEPFSVLEAQARAAGLAAAQGGVACGPHRLMCFTKA